MKEPTHARPRVERGTLRELRVRDTRPPLTQPAMSRGIDRHDRIRLTSRWIELDEHPAILVTGEMHYARVPPHRWEEELRLLAASGLTSVSTYVFWIHHEQTRGRIHFDGQYDIAAFIETADRIGIDVNLRIGPWCHGEARNGGLPDWVLELSPATRTDDPDYLGLVAEWFRALGGQVGRFCGESGRVVGIQLENELYDQPQHIATLKGLARQGGMSAPIWTATGWGGALLPSHEVFPLYGGYSDGFWIDQGADWGDAFRQHFAFSHVWDDPGVGADQRDRAVEVVVRDIDPEFPPATCELGGGMPTAYHRRPVARPLDLAAIANVKLGNGSAWQGFYMYAAGVNPVDQVQESHSTGYPNDLPRFDYEWNGAIGSTGRPGPALPLLREHNAFISSFGDRFARMFSTLPDDAPIDVRDTTSLRWAVRSDGRSGMIFLSTHQPYEPLASVKDVRLRIHLVDGVVTVPDRPIDLPSGLVARWPLRLEVAEVRIEWATASVAGLVPGELPTLVLRAHDDVPVGIEFASGTSVVVDGRSVSADEPLHPSPGEVIVLDDALRVLIVDEVRGDRLWYLGDELIEAEDAVWVEDGRLVARAERRPEISRWTGTGFSPVEMRTISVPQDAVVPFESLRVAGEPPARYGQFMGRSSAPTDAQVDEFAAVWRLDLLDQAPGAGDRVELVIDWDGDVAQLRADGRVIADRFWNGLEWRLDITDLDLSTELTLHVVPITTASVVDLDEQALARVRAHGRLCELRRVRRVVSIRWIEATGGVPNDTPGMSIVAGDAFRA